LPASGERQQESIYMLGPCRPPHVPRLVRCEIVIDACRQGGVRACDGRGSWSKGPWRHPDVCSVAWQPRRLDGRYCDASSMNVLMARFSLNSIILAIFTASASVGQRRLAETGSAAVAPPVADAVPTLDFAGGDRLEHVMDRRNLIGEVAVTDGLLAALYSVRLILLEVESTALANQDSHVAQQRVNVVEDCFLRDAKRAAKRRTGPKRRTGLIIRPLHQTLLFDLTPA